MSINLQELRDRIGREFMGSGPDFDADFLEACRDVASDLAREAFQNISAEDITSIADVLAIAYDKCYPVFRDGVPYFLQRKGVYAKKSEINYKANYDQALAKAQYMQITEDGPESGVPERT